MEEEYSLDDLVQLSGVNLRTIRFYIQEGLLPGPDSRGKFAHYSQRHLDTLTLIQRFKRFNMPLVQIKQVLANSTADEISQMVMYQNILNPTQNQTVAKTPDQRVEQTDSALDYLRNLENVWAKAQSTTRTRPAPAPAPSIQAASPAPVEPVLKNKISPTEVETWQRHRLTEGVDLMIRSDHPIDEAIIRKIAELLQSNQS